MLKKTSSWKFQSIPARARINYTLTLDITRSIFLSRAYIAEKERVKSGSIMLDLQQQKCVRVDFFVKVSYSTSIV